MKSEHRHDLQTNELGKLTDQVVSRVGGIFEVYGNQLLIAFCVLCIGGAYLIYHLRTGRLADASAWRDLANAQNAEDFSDVWKNHADTPAALWARVHEGESRLAEGIKLLFSNVESATSELKLARGAFESVIERRSAPADVRERALFGLARALEGLSDGNEGEAVKAYESLLREFPRSIYKQDAEDRLAALAAGSGQEFYAWFAKYERPKLADKRPLDRGAADEDLDASELINDLKFQAPTGNYDEPPAGDAAEKMDLDDQASGSASEASEEGAAEADASDGPALPEGEGSATESGGDKAAEADPPGESPSP